MGEKMAFTDMDQYLFGQGTHYDIYKKLGAHPVKQDGVSGVYFAVWAPNAQKVSVIGDFNGWNPDADPMEKAGPIGVYQTFVPGAKIGELYKFHIIGYQLNPVTFGIYQYALKYGHRSFGRYSL